jgi:hypothetical protein
MYRKILAINVTIFDGIWQDSTDEGCFRHGRLLMKEQPTFPLLTMGGFRNDIGGPGNPIGLINASISQQHRAAGGGRDVSEH